MHANLKVWNIIEEIKAGNLTMEEAKGMLSSKEWNTLNDVLEISASPRFDPNYTWSNGIILDPVNK